VSRKALNFINNARLAVTLGFTALAVAGLAGSWRRHGAHVDHSQQCPCFKDCPRCSWEAVTEKRPK
jgi:hypothetical protein